MIYVAFLRGVNVNGNLLPMKELRDALAAAGFADVRTYIQSGNILFSSDDTDKAALAARVADVIRQAFNKTVAVVVFSGPEWEAVVAAAPAWWGKDPEWKHNLLILIPPFTMDTVVAAIGELKPDIEAMEPGNGVIYQSMSFKLFGRTTTGKLASNPVYKQMTIRNYNTAKKLTELCR